MHASELRDEPAYGLAEASRYLKLPSATLRSWVVGREYPTADGTERWQPLIQAATSEPATVLSFWNLVEAHVLRALRTDHGIAIKSVRDALDFAERELNIPRLLLSAELATHAGKLFLERYGELVDLSASGQMAMKHVFEEHLERVEWDGLKLPTRLYPFATVEGARRPIVIDPSISFGRPVVSSGRISTAAIVERIDAGESAQELADDYELSVAEIEGAVVYERAA